MKLHIAFFLFTILIWLGKVIAQPLAPALATPITVDLSKRLLTGTIPFDKSFYLTGEIKSEWNIHTVKLEISKGRNASNMDYKEVSRFIVTGNAPLTTLFLLYAGGEPEKDFLLPDREYTLKVTALNNSGAELPNYSFTYGFLTSSKFGDHAKTDFGVGYAPKPKALFGAITVHLYLTAINDETNLQAIKNIRRNIFLRTSVFFGFAPTLLSSDVEQPIKNKYGIGNFVYGIAIRSPFYGAHTTFKNRVGQKLLQPMRITFGEYLFKQANANPLIATDQNKKAFYVGLSFDFNVAAVLGPVSKLIQP